MKIYHGSEIIIESPQFGFGNPHNDYGLGFYCTENLELAKEWACQKNKNGFANCYELDTTKLSILDLSELRFSIQNTNKEIQKPALMYLHTSIGSIMYRSE